jgi:hypothetical protein
MIKTFKSLTINDKPRTGMYFFDTLMASILFCHCSGVYVFRGGAEVDDDDADV